MSVTANSNKAQREQVETSAEHTHSCRPLWMSPSDEPMNADDLQLLVTYTMPYGKYQGRVIADLPGNYLNWFARRGFPSGKLGQLLALMHELDHNGLSSLLKPLRQP